MSAKAQNQAAIRLEQISVAYGQFAALDRLSLTVGKGELLTVLGPSGSGKSTLLNIVAGSVEATSGKIFFDDQDVTDLPSHKRRVGMVFQRYTLFPNRTVAENVAFPLEIRKVDKVSVTRRVKDALDMVGLSAQTDRYPSEISGGQAQRAALARAVVFDPSILLMDEPLGALDRALRKSLQYEIRRLQQRLQVPMLYVTHDQEEAMSLSDRIVILRDGKITAEGSPRALYENPNSVWTANFLGDANCLPFQGTEIGKDGLVLANIADGIKVPASQNINKAASQSQKIVIRPENCRISKMRDDKRAFCPGVVKWTEYLGSMQRVRLDVLGTDFIAQIAGKDDGYAVGEHVFVGWNAEDALIVGDL